MNGVLIGRGRPLNRGQRLEGLRITDVFPSILGLMGLEIPDDVDGRIPDRMFTAEFLHEHPVRWGAASPETRRQSFDKGGHEEEREVMERLRNLGYLE